MGAVGVRQKEMEGGDKEMEGGESATIMNLPKVLRKVVNKSLNKIF